MKRTKTEDTSPAEDSLIRIATVMARTGLKRTSVYVMAKEGMFPKQVKLGPRSSAWSKAAIDAWIEQRKQRNSITA